MNIAINLIYILHFRYRTRSKCCFILHTYAYLFCRSLAMTENSPQITSTPFTTENELLYVNVVVLNVLLLKFNMYCKGKMAPKVK